MILEDFTIPSAFFLSLFFLKIQYTKVHLFAIFLCGCGMACSICNDLYVKKVDNGGQDYQISSMIIGDIMSLCGAFLYALSNILQEHFLKSQRDVNHYLGFLGLFGCLITLIEALFFGDYKTLINFIKTSNSGQIWFFVQNMGGFMFLTFICYSIIPYFVQRSGATLLNISNVTTVIWSMISDIIFFKKPFYYLYLLAFCFEICGVIIFS